MSNVFFQLSKSVSADPEQTGICWEVTNEAYIPVANRQITDPLPRKNDDDLLSALSRVGQDISKIDILPGKLSRGEYFPRIVRPILGDSRLEGLELWPYADQAAYRNSHKQLQILIEMLEDVFRVLHPVEKNFASYGHEIRNLLLLATMEVESAFIAILKTNSITPFNKRYYTTKDYVRLREPLRLEEFRVKLFRYPWLPDFEPFVGWDNDKSTQSLAWYNAYNAVKHDREENFQEAKLEHAINAVLAVHVLLVSQFGQWAAEDETSFELTQKPQWHRDQLYIPPAADIPWKESRLVL